jgi:hypothetical protein
MTTNTKIVIGTLVVVILIIGGFFLFAHPANTDVPATTAQTPIPITSTTSAVSQPNLTLSQSENPDGVKIVETMTFFDASSLVSTSTYPTITGTANIPQVGILITNSKNVGIVKTSVPVVNGHWSYPCSVALAPGVYNLILFTDNIITGNAKLTVNKA